MVMNWLACRQGVPFAVAMLVDPHETPRALGSDQVRNERVSNAADLWN